MVMAVSAGVRCRKYWNGELAPRTASRVPHSITISGARGSIAVENLARHNLTRNNPRELRKHLRERITRPQETGVAKVATPHLHRYLEMGSHLPASLSVPSVPSQAAGEDRMRTQRNE